MDPFKKLRKMYNDAGVTIYAMEAAQREHVGRGVRVHLQRGRSARRDAHDARAARRRQRGGTAQADRRLRDEEEDLRRVPHARAGQHDGVRSRRSRSRRATWRTSTSATGSRAATSAARRCSSSRSTTIGSASFHLKDRTTPEHCALNLAWGTGETPIKEILQLVRKNKWKIPASIELEYDIPEGSDAVKETRKCVEYCRAALTART